MGIFEEESLDINIKENKSLDENNSQNLISELKNFRVAQRGIDPQDYKWFSNEAILILQKAQKEVEWLLGRGYNSKSVIDFVGNSYQFSIRQRNALQRSTSSKALSEKRKSKALTIENLKDGCVYIDGFNIIITLEVALSKGILVRGNDTTIRDIAGLRGTYSVIDKTERALEVLGKTLCNLEVPNIKIFLDAPVSNSGRLKNRIESHSDLWNIPVEVELVRNADHILVDLERVVTSDSIILDNCISWFNLTEVVISEHITDAKIINLSDG
jgi:hypothetical protein